MAGQPEGLAGIGDLGLHEFVEAAVDAVGDGVQQLDALRHGHAAPGAVQRVARGLHRGVDFSLAGFVDVADQGVVGGIAVLERAGGADPLAVDEVFEVCHVGSLVLGRVSTTASPFIDWVLPSPASGRREQTALKSTHSRTPHSACGRDRRSPCPVRCPST
ncbi:hypothetical protein D9M69_524560 [compost metagenome]